jgi:hypothetical protein
VPSRAAAAIDLAIRLADQPDIRYRADKQKSCRHAQVLVVA